MTDTTELIDKADEKRREDERIAPVIAPGVEGKP